MQRQEFIPKPANRLRERGDTQVWVFLPRYSLDMLEVSPERNPVD